MTFHINPATGNPNVCRSKTCDLAHFETKEAAAGSKPDASTKASHAVKEVKEELAKDKAVSEASNGATVTPARNLPPVIAEAVTQEVAAAERKPIAVKKIHEETVVKRLKPKKKVLAKQQVKRMVLKITDRVADFAYLAPRHPLAKGAKKALQKLRK